MFEQFKSSDVARLTALFASHASGDSKGDKVMLPADFAIAIRPAAANELFPLSGAHIDLLFTAADRERRGFLSLADFLEFQTLLAKPHAEDEIVLALVARSAGLPLSAEPSVADVRSFFATHRNPASSPINFDAEPLRLLLAGNGSRRISIGELAEAVRALRSEQLYAEYKRADPSNSGTISGTALREIIAATAGHRISPSLLAAIPSAFPTASFADVHAFHSVLSKLDAVASIISKASASNATGLVSRTDFASIASKHSTYDGLSPLEIDVVFRSLGAGDLHAPGIPPAAFGPLLNPSFSIHAKETKTVQLSAAMETAKSLYNFMLGSVAGAIGATFVYPIDLVKTRMQNQRKKVVGQLLYTSSWDCFRKVLKNEGVVGLYSGLLPQLVGVAPEKAIKLTMNDLVRSRLKNQQTGETPLWAEIAAGCAGGGSQVLFTNPLEIVKIRLQVQGEVAKAGIEGAAPKQSAISIVRQLGLFGLYKGVGACLLRDIPFSGIYFPVYAHLKKDLFHEGVNGKKLSTLELLTAGAIAGMPAAYFVTPADVIKTRLQVAARRGESTYAGIADAFVKIMREEGPTAFFKGGVARVFRSSPQFGVTLASYEMLKNYLSVDFGDTPKTPNQVVATSHLPSGEAGLRNVVRLFGDLSLSK